MTAVLTNAGLTSARETGKRAFLAGALRVPLVLKLVGANVIIIAAAIVVASGNKSYSELITVIGALGTASIVNLILVGIALRPVRELERVAERVSKGEFTVRSAESPVADASLSRLGTIVNTLLDSLAAEKKRIQVLGAEVIYAEDAERARVSRELHDSVAQTLAAIRLQLAAASNDATGDLRNRLVAVNALVSTAIQDVRSVSYSLHPRVAVDLGLEAALTALARQVQTRSGVDVKVNAIIEGPSIPANVSATLFRVAREALRNIEMHAHAKTATVEVGSRNGSVRIQVTDDGCGFDQTLRAPSGRTGLSSVQDRVNLAGGTMTIDSVLNGGTRVVAEMKRSVP